jgi:hypothetical protein
MIKLNIKKTNQDGITSIQFITIRKKSDLLLLLMTFDFYGVTEVFYKDKTSKTIQDILTDKIWDMNVGSSIEHSDYTFSIRGKSPYHNTNHGKQMYGS